MHHHNQDVAALRVQSREQIPGYPETGKRLDTGVFGVFDGVTNMTLKVKGHRSALVAETAAKAQMDSVQFRLHSSVGDEMLAKLAELIKVPGSFGQAIKLVQETLIETAIADSLHKLEAENVRWKNGYNPNALDQAQYFVDMAEAQTVNKLRSGDMPGASSAVLGVVLPNPDAKGKSTHFAYLYGICGEEDAGNVFIIRDGVFHKIIEGPFTEKRQFIKPGTQINDYQIKGVRIPLRPGDTLVVTTDGLNRDAS